MAGAKFVKLSSSGIGALKRALGPTTAGPFMLNAVELQFDIDPIVRAQCSALTARQWLGPDAHWIKRGSPLVSPWLKITPPAPSDYDDSPDPANVFDNGSAIFYYDNPGPTPFSALYTGATRIQIVQNFTGWIEGKSRSSGKADALTDAPAAWFSIIDIVDENMDRSAGDTPKWAFTAATSRGLGWRDVSSAPVI